MRTSHRIAAAQFVHRDASNRSSAKADIDIETLPFTPGDITAGTENELQALVVGKRTTVDLPLTIERSKYYSNIVRRIAVGEASTALIRELQKFLSDNDDQVWENSWVRFPRKYLSPFASNLLDQDLKVNSGEYEEARSDRDKFVFATNWGEWVRIPISYLVKLALADVVGTQPFLPSSIKEIAIQLLPHFSNDLTSPETFSFHLIDSTYGPHSDWQLHERCHSGFCSLTCSLNGQTKS
jgi:hypothetical protein